MNVKGQYNATSRKTEKCWITLTRRRAWVRVWRQRLYAVREFGFRVLSQAMNANRAFQQSMHDENSSWTSRSPTVCHPLETTV